MADPNEANAPPLSPTSAHAHDAEKARLGALLKNRPEAKELQDKNILKSTSGIAPSLVAAQASLQKSQLEDKLEKATSHRPDRSELERLGILKPGNVAPGLQARQEELRKAQLEDKLEKGLERRPERGELEQQGILKGGSGGSVAPGLIARQEELKRAQLKDELGRGVGGRPTREELEQAGILKKDE